MKFEIDDKTHQKLLEIIDRLGQPIDTEQAGLLDMRQYYFKFDAKQNMRTVKN